MRVGLALSVLSLQVDEMTLQYMLEAVRPPLREWHHKLSLLQHERRTCLPSPASSLSWTCVL